MSALGEIHTAIDAGDQQTLQQALAGMDGDARVATGPDSPILYALYRGKRALLPTLLESDRPLDIFDAAATGQVDRARDLLRNAPGLACAYTSDGFTALHYAGFFGGDQATAEALLDAGADVNAVARNPTLVQPLHSAVAGGSGTVARLLVERGADVNARQQGGFTALMAAAQNGAAEDVEWFLAHGADPAARTEDGRSAADIAEQAGHLALAERLRR